MERLTPMNTRTISRAALLPATLALTAWFTPAFADEVELPKKAECEGVEKQCEGAEKQCDGADATNQKTVSARIAALEAGAAEGCKSSASMLAKLQKTAKVDSVTALKEKVAACEKHAGMGCSVSADVLKTMNTEFAKKTAARPMALSARLAKLETGCSKGCKKSGALMASLLKKFDAKSSADLVKQVKSWETKAAGGCTKCVDKLATLRAMMPAKRPALSARLSKLASFCEKGCEKSSSTMADLVKANGAKDAAGLVVMVQDWEAKAAKGCTKCKDKLSKLSASMPNLALSNAGSDKAASKASDSDCESKCGVDCEKSGKDCEGCPSATKNPGS